MTDKICITPGACILGACMLLLLPLKWSLSVASAAIFHELFHYCAVKLLRGTVYSITIGAAGITMEIGKMTKFREIICALAGPAGSLLLLLFWERIPLIGLCAGIQGVFNLLPILPLDGGIALNNILCFFLSESKASRACCVIGITILAGFLLMGLGCTLLFQTGWITVVVPGMIFCRFLIIAYKKHRSGNSRTGFNAERKTPCKTGRMGLQ